MANDEAPFELEFTWNRVQEAPYENGGKDTHIAFKVDDFEAFHRLHEEMGCIARENKAMGLYFITDPDGNWIEILPENR
jgi:lactoylglutathione lyase